VAGKVIDVREANDDDLEPVADLWKMLAEYHEELADEFALSWDSRKRWSDYLREKYSEMSTKLIVADEEGELVGFMLCLLSPNVPIYRDRKLGVISDVYVREDLRRKGIAKKMFDMAAEWFAKNRVRSVQLNVAAANLEGRAAWRSLGFEPFMITKRLSLEQYRRGGLKKRPARIVRSRGRKRRVGVRRRL
jgi:ribosomal protein S18 acetylase RimI-like enzyme